MRLNPFSKCFVRKYVHHELAYTLFPTDQLDEPQWECIMPQWPFHSSHQFWRINIRGWSPCSALYLALLWICSEVLSLLQLQEGGFSKVGSHLNGLIGVIGKPVIGEDTLHLKNVNCRLKSAQLSILSPDSYQVGLTALAPVDVCSWLIVQSGRWKKCLQERNHISKWDFSVVLRGWWGRYLVPFSDDINVHHFIAQIK